jgi:hypothetical protein
VGHRGHVTARPSNTSTTAFSRRRPDDHEPS